MSRYPTFSTRRKNHQKNVQKYLKWMVNDHAMISIVFLWMVLMMRYAQFIHQLEQVSFIHLIILSTCCTATLLFGKWASFLLPADAYFMRMNVSYLQMYFAKVRQYSWIFPFLIQAATLLLILPVLNKFSTYLLGDVLFLFVLMAAMKGFDFTLQWRKMTSASVPNGSLFLLIVGSFLSYISFFILPFHWKFILVVFISEISYLFYMREIKKDPILQVAIERENDRISKQLRWLSLFVDVNVPTTISYQRRKWADIFLPKILQRKSSILFDLYLRSLIRNHEYVYFLCFTLVAYGCLGAYIQDIWTSSLLLIPLHFMGLFKLLTLKQVYVYHPLVQQMALNLQKQKDAILSLARKYLLIAHMVWGICMSIFHFKVEFLLVGLISLLISQGMILYIKIRKNRDFF